MDQNELHIVEQKPKNVPDLLCTYHYILKYEICHWGIFYHTFSEHNKYCINHVKALNISLTCRYQTNSLNILEEQVPSLIDITVN